MEHLTDRELSIAKYRYGLFDCDMTDAKSIGKMFKIRGKKLIEMIQKIDEKTYNLIKDKGLDYVVEAQLDTESDDDNSY